MKVSRRSLLATTAQATLALPVLLSTVRVGAASSDTPFALGVASGEPRPDGFVLWTRLMGEDLPADRDIPVDWEVGTDEGLRTVVARGTAAAEGAWAHSVHAVVTGLQPDRPYWYRFIAQGVRSATGRSRTAPAPGADATLHFVIASCQRYDQGHYAAWAHVAAEQPDLVLFLGDYIYESGSPPGRIRLHEGGAVTTLEGYRRRYAQYRNDPLLQAAHAAAPWVVTWDDHEVENDYAGVQGQRLQPRFEARRRAAYQAFWEHMPLPPALRPDLGVPGGALPLYRRLDWGRLARLHVLDMRQYRDPQPCPQPGRGGSNTVTLRDCPALRDPQRSLLGAAQESWLEQGWDLQRPWNLLAQTTLMAPWSWSDPEGPTGGTWWTDGWGGYPAARDRLLQPVAERQVPGVVVLGGDVHANYVADLHAPAGAGTPRVVATEFCGTSITSEGLPQDRLQRALRLHPHVHHARSDQRGYVSFSLDKRALQARLNVLDDVLDPTSAQRTAARYTVRTGEPGVLA